MHRILTEEEKEQIDTARCHRAAKEFERCLRNNTIDEIKYDMLCADYFNEEWDSAYPDMEFKIGHAFLTGNGCEIDKHRSLEFIVRANYALDQKLNLLGNEATVSDRILKVLIMNDINALQRKYKSIDFTRVKGYSKYPLGFDTFTCGVAQISFQKKGKSAVITCKQHLEEGEEADLTEIIEFPESGYIEFTKEVTQVAQGVTELWPQNGRFLADEWKLDGPHDVNRLYYKGQLMGWIKAKKYVYHFKMKNGYEN